MQVLAADVTFGYHCQFGRVNSVNGVDIMHIYQLAHVCDTCTSEFVIFDLQPCVPPPLLRRAVLCFAVRTLFVH